MYLQSGVGYAMAMRRLDKLLITTCGIIVTIAAIMSIYPPSHVGAQSGVGGGGIVAIQPIVPDPCETSSTAKLTVFANITTATTTALVAPSGSTRVFVCEALAQLNSTTASTILLEQGTGVACAGGPAPLTATYTNSTIVSEVLPLGAGNGTFLTTGAGNGVCAVTTVGTSPTIPVTITFVQQ